MTTRAARGLPSKTDPSVHPTSLTPNFASWLVQQLLLIQLLSWRKVQNEKGTCQCMCSMAKIKSMPGRDMLSMEGWGNILEGMWMSWGKKRQWHAIGLCPFRKCGFCGHVFKQRVFDARLLLDHLTLPKIWPTCHQNFGSKLLFSCLTCF